MTPTRQPRADSLRNRDALLDAAMRALRVDPDASLHAIAAEAGLTRRAVYSHFPGRDPLVDAALERGASRIAAAVDLPPAPDPLATLARRGGALWAHVAEVHAVARMAVSGTHAAAVALAMAPVHARVRACLAQARAEGAVRDDVDLHTLAVLVERAALDVLDLAEGVDPVTARLLAVTHPLCAAGVGARDAARIAAGIEEA